MLAVLIFYIVQRAVTSLNAAPMRGIEYREENVPDGWLEARFAESGLHRIDPIARDQLIVNGSIAD